MDSVRRLSGSSASPVTTQQIQDLQLQVKTSLETAEAYTGQQALSLQQWVADNYFAVYQRFDFQANGSAYFTTPVPLSVAGVTVKNGTGSGTAVITYAVNGAGQSIPFGMAANDELTVTVSGLSATRVSFTLLFGKPGPVPVSITAPVLS